MANKTRYVAVLFDRDTNGQITASFNDINSIDQVKEGLVRQMKAWQESRPTKAKDDVDIDEVVRKHLELKV